MEQHRRYWRWLKRATIFLVIYVVVGYLFLGVQPSDALGSPPRTSRPFFCSASSRAPSMATSPPVIAATTPTGR